MRIKALEDWTYTPAFGGNRDEAEELQTAYTFTVLSGKDEMKLRKEGIETFPTSLETVIRNVKNPPLIIDGKGKEREVTVAEIGTAPELNGLYMELIVEYGSHATLDGVSAKN